MSARGDEYYQMAEKQLKKRFFKKERYQDAVDLFKKAGNSYKSTKDWSHAGDAYSRATECYKKLKNPIQSALTAISASEMYSKEPDSFENATNMLNYAINFYKSTDDASKVGNLLCQLAELLETQKKYDEAIKSYEEASKYYQTSREDTQATNQLIKIGDLYCLLNRWIDAANIYKKIAQKYLENSLTELIACKYCTKVILCRIAGDDTIGAESQLTELGEKSRQWKLSEEYTMLQQCLKGIEDGNYNEFNSSISKYNEYKDIDEWTKKIFDAIRDTFNDENEEDIC